MTWKSPNGLSMQQQFLLKKSDQTYQEVHKSIQKGKK